METDTLPTLLQCHEPAAFAIENNLSKAQVLIVCDHASAWIPELLDQLGLGNEDLATHFAIDIGALHAARHIATALGAPLIFQQYSRLVIDCNRYPSDQMSIVQSIGTRPVPGNLNLSPIEARQRLYEIFLPYQIVIRRQLSAIRKRNVVPVLISIHSFTQEFNTQQRPWSIALSFDADTRMATPIVENLRTQDVTVGVNKPYSLDLGLDFTVVEHALRHGFPHLQVEFRQEDIDTQTKATQIADEFLTALRPVLANPDIYEIQCYCPELSSQSTLPDTVPLEFVP